MYSLVMFLQHKARFAFTLQKIQYNNCCYNPLDISTCWFQCCLKWGEIGESKVWPGFFTDLVSSFKLIPGPCIQLHKMALVCFPPVLLYKLLSLCMFFYHIPQIKQISFFLQTCQFLPSVYCLDLRKSFPNCGAVLWKLSDYSGKILCIIFYFPLFSNTFYDCWFKGIQPNISSLILLTTSQAARVIQSLTK